MTDQLTQALIQQNMVSLSKKRGGSSRSRMLKAIMPHLSQENGDRLAAALDDHNSAAFRKVWDSIRAEITSKFGATASANADEQALANNMEEFEMVVLASYEDTNDVALIEGAGRLKDQLRELLANSVIMIGPNLLFRIVQIETKISKLGGVPSFHIMTDIYDQASADTVRSFRTGGKMVRSVLDALMLGRHYAEKITE